MVGDLVDAVVRHARDRDPARTGRLEVDVVDADPDPDDPPHGVGPLDRRRADLGELHEQELGPVPVERGDDVVLAGARLDDELVLRPGDQLPLDECVVAEVLVGDQDAHAAPRLVLRLELRHRPRPRAP